MTARLSGARVVASAFALLVVWAAPAHAAPTYVSSEPADGERVHKAPAEVSVTFSEPLDQSSTLEVRNACGKRADDRDVRVDGNTMTVGLASNHAGTYTVVYEATGLAGITGTTTDDFHFEVHMGPSCDGSGGGHHGGHHGGGHGNGSGRHGGHGGTTSPDDSDDHGTGEHRDGHDGGAGHTATHDSGGRHDGGHDDHGDDETGSEDGGQTTAAPGDTSVAQGPQPTSASQAPATSAAAITALALAALLGVVGGVILRVSGSS